jgi:hypothetical protein
VARAKKEVELSDQPWARQDIRDAKFDALRRSVQYRKILETDGIRKVKFQEHSTSYKRASTRELLLKQAYWYGSDKYRNGLRYDGEWWSTT